MAHRSLRRRFDLWKASRDWLEGTLIVVGILFFLLSLVFAAAAVTLLVHIDQHDHRMPVGGAGGKVFGVLLMGTGAMVTAGVAWALAGSRLSARIRRRWG